MAQPVVMKTVDRALGLLAHFSVVTPEMGLSDLARAAGLDKATVLRLLASLRKHGFVEQDPVSKRFRLGTALLHYARVREDCFPLVRVVGPILGRLAAAAGETAHTALVVGDSFSSVMSAEPDRTTRVHIDWERVPLHATASGLALLAFSGPDLFDHAVRQGLEDYTARTVRTPEALRAVVDATRTRGYSVSSGALDSEVTSVGAPIFGPVGIPIGTIAIACVASRWKAQQESEFGRLVMDAAVEASRAIGGNPSPGFLATVQELAGNGRRPVA